MEPTRAFDRILHGIAGLGPLLFLALATTEGALRAGYDPVAQPISALALGPRGWIQEVNFAVLAVSFLAFAVVLRRTLRGGTSSVAAPGVFLLMTLGVAVAGAFPMDAPGAPETLSGRLHVAAGFLVFPWMPVASFLAARRFRHDARWRRYFVYTVVTAIVCLATIVFFLLFVGPPGAGSRRFPRLSGLVQRAQFLAFFAWMALVSRRAYQAARRTRVSRSDVSRAAGLPA